MLKLHAQNFIGGKLFALIAYVMSIISFWHPISLCDDIVGIKTNTYKKGRPLSVK